MREPLYRRLCRGRYSPSVWGKTWKKNTNSVVVVVCSNPRDSSTLFLRLSVRGVVVRFAVVRFGGRKKRPGKTRGRVRKNFVPDGRLTGKRRVHAAGSKLFPVRTAPPDGTTFAQVTVGDKAEGELPAFGYWNVQFYHPRAAYVRFDYEFPRGASIAVYGRRNALPTHTQYEILELLNGFESPRRARSTHVSQLSRLEYTVRLSETIVFARLANGGGAGV